MHFFLRPPCAVVASTVACQGKRVFFLASQTFQHVFKITYNLPHTINARCIRAVARYFLVKTIFYSPHWA